MSRGLTIILSVVVGAAAGAAGWNFAKPIVAPDPEPEPRVVYQYVGKKPAAPSGIEAPPWWPAAKQELPAAPKKVVPIATLDAKKGDYVAIDRAAVVVPAEAGTELYPGDRVKTGKGSLARVKFIEGSTMSLGASTELALDSLKFKEKKSRIANLSLLYGQFIAEVSKVLVKDSHFEVKTPAVVAGVRGTTFWSDTERDALCVLEGKVEVKSLANADAKPELVEEGNGVTKMSSGSFGHIKPSADDIKAYREATMIE